MDRMWSPPALPAARGRAPGFAMRACRRTGDRGRRGATPTSFFPLKGGGGQTLPLLGGGQGGGGSSQVKPAAGGESPGLHMRACPRTGDRGRRGAPPTSFLPLKGGGGQTLPHLGAPSLCSGVLCEGQGGCGSSQPSASRL